jgi:hypothetical protein
LREEGSQGSTWRGPDFYVWDEDAREAERWASDLARASRGARVDLGGADVWTCAWCGRSHWRTLWSEGSRPAARGCPAGTDELLASELADAWLVLSRGERLEGLRLLAPDEASRLLLWLEPRDRAALLHALPPAERQLWSRRLRWDEHRPISHGICDECAQRGLRPAAS